MSFVDQRHAPTMGYPSQDGAILGENISPLMCICRPDRHSCPERFMESEYIYRPLTGPPFQIVRPRLEWGDSGTRGCRAQIYRGKQAGFFTRGGLAVRVVECEDYDDEMSEDEIEGEDTPNLPARGISDYEVRATILQVFVENE
ncbi:hypothetical protein DFH09DRAFT_1099232 [Mycena vulgaris]|nr:hypothetical protein DFH09DRAFT_1099232 [Mycena vulgaris]